jgi:hypothetical protein
MSTKQTNIVSKDKNGKTERQQRLGVALRANLRKRKSQTQEREKGREIEKEEGVQHTLENLS